ncbi:uncharacterized protein LOC117301550 [Asterias rubens]|uniref:uncharacterized protein LOC117301550 n=1 Tax=Asterias rubens TaxID=7604 RepID=UPI0014553A44|nr:uncharacterized protein LOC117301550 [Asterias rubens]
MFTVSSVQSVLPFEREKDLDELLSSDTPNDEVQSVWATTGHLFLSLNNGFAMKAFDTAPVNQKVPKDKRVLTVHQTTSEIIDVCALKRKTAPVYIAHSNGVLKVWLYSNTGGWVHLGNINVCTSQKATLHAITIDEGRGRVIWVEGQSNGIQDGCHYSVCTRTITFETTNVKYSVGPATTLLQNCPHCALYSSPLAISIWPSDPCPKGLYFTWHSDSYRLKNQLNTNVLSRGRCLSEERADMVVDFKSAASKLRHIWVQTASHPNLDVIARASHLSTGVLFLLSSNGYVHSLNGAEECLNAFKLPDCIDVAQGSDWFAYRHTLGAIFKDRIIRLFSKKSGELLQELNVSAMSTNQDVKLFSTVGTIPRVGVWTSKGIWLLQMSNVQSLSSNISKSEAISTLRDFNEDRLATQTAIQDAYNTFSGKSNEVMDENEGQAVAGEGFQNPSLMVALMKGADDKHKPAASQVLESLYDEKDTKPEVKTKLNESMNPLLQQYWQLYQQKMDVWEGQVNAAQKPYTVKKEVLRLLDSTSTVSSNVKRSQLTLLCLHFPMATLSSFLDALNVGSIDDKGHVTFQAIPLDDEELDLSVPVISLAASAPDSNSGLPIFETICRLIYKETPTQLVDFVQLCQQIRDKVTDESAFLRKKCVGKLYDIALGSLPGPDHSRNREGAVLAKAELLHLSSISHGHLNALKLLLKHKLWSESINLVQKLADNSLTHSELFHVLLTSLLQEREIISQYCDQLWGCLPKQISSLEFLKLLTTHHQPSNPRIHLCQQVLCRPQDDLQIGMVRNQLMKMLQQEKVKGQ